MCVILNMFLDIVLNIFNSGFLVFFGNEDSFKLNNIEKKIIGNILFFVIEVKMLVGISDKIVFIRLWLLFCICLVVFLYWEILIMVNVDILMLCSGWNIFVKVILIIMVIVVIILK